MSRAQDTPLEHLYSGADRTQIDNLRQRDADLRDRELRRFLSATHLAKLRSETPIL